MVMASAPGSVAAQAVSCDRLEVAPIVEAAVRDAVGNTSQVSATLVSCDVLGQPAIDAALLEPGGRFGRPVRVRLMSGGRQRGSAVAVFAGMFEVVRTIRPVGAGKTVDEADVAVSRADAPGALIEPLPGQADIVGARALRDLVVGEIVTSRIVQIPPAVRSGDRVVVRATVGTVQVSGVATAQQTGRIGDVIRLVNTGSRRALRARITARGEVEVLYGS